MTLPGTIRKESKCGMKRNVYFLNTFLVAKERNKLTISYKKIPYLLVSFQIHFDQKAHILTYSYILLYMFF